MRDVSDQTAASFHRPMSIRDYCDAADVSYPTGHARVKRCLELGKLTLVRCRLEDSGQVSRIYLNTDLALQIKQQKKEASHGS